MVEVQGLQSIEVLLSNKQRSREWYEKMLAYYGVLGRNVLREDFDYKKMLFELYNNDLSGWRSVLARMCSDVLTRQIIEDEQIQVHNKLRSKISVLLGDLQRMLSPRLFNVTLNGAASLRHKNMQYQEQLSRHVAEDMRLIEEYVRRGGVIDDSFDIEAWMRAQRRELTPEKFYSATYEGDLEIFLNRLRNYVWYKDSLADKIVDSAESMFIIGEIYLKVHTGEGRPTIMVLNPLNVFYVNAPDERNICKADLVGYIEELPLVTFMERYAAQMDRRDLEEFIMELWNTHSPQYSRTGDGERLVRNWLNYYVNRELSEGSGFSSPARYYEHEDMMGSFVRRTVRLTHVEFKAFDDVGYYSYIDEYGVRNSMFVDAKDGSSRLVPPDASEITYYDTSGIKHVKKVWNVMGRAHEYEVIRIPQTYEAYIAGSGKLVLGRKSPMQFVDPHDPYNSWCNSFVGVKLNNINAKGVSRLELAVPAQLEILVLKAIFDREMAKYRGSVIGRDVDQIPIELSELLGGDQRDKLSAIEAIGRVTGVEYFDSGASRNGIIPSTRSAPIVPLQIGNSGELKQIQEIIAMLEAEIGMVLGVPPSREGIVMPYTNAADNQQALLQTMLATQRDMVALINVWGQAIEMLTKVYMRYFKDYYSNHQGDDPLVLQTYFQDGTREMLTITPEMLDYTDWGMQPVDIYSQNKFMTVVEAMVMQNTTEMTMEERMEILGKIVNNASMEDVNRWLREYGRKAEERMRQAQQAQVDMQREALKLQQEIEKYRSDLNLAARLAELEARSKFDLQKAEIYADQFRRAQDVDRNMKSDLIERQQSESETRKEIEKLRSDTAVKIAKIKAEAAKEKGAPTEKKDS